jgi:hypothetical protein
MRPDTTTTPSDTTDDIPTLEEGEVVEEPEAPPPRLRVHNESASTLPQYEARGPPPPRTPTTLPSTSAESLEVEELLEAQPRDGVHPGGLWVENLDSWRTNGSYPVTIPEPLTGRHDRAPFIRYDLDAESPQIYATRGRNCREYRFPLKAKPVPYPRPRLTTRQQHLFDSGEEFTTLVDRALQQEGDLSLTAEVQRYRNALYDVQLSARRMVQARQALDDAQWAVRDSANRLAAANAYQRVEPHIFSDPVRDQFLDDGQALNTFHAYYRRNPIARRIESDCKWCGALTHDTQACYTLTKCPHCLDWGHEEMRCRQPHKRCTRNAICKVRPDHPEYFQKCRSHIRTHIA